MINGKLCMNYELLADVAQIIMGQSPPSSTYNTVGEGLPFYQGKADFGDMYPTPRVYCTEPSRVAEAGDILISVRAPVGPTNISRERSAIGRGLSVIRAGKKLDRDFLLYFLRFYEPELAKAGTGSTFAAIAREDLETIKIPLPPLSEQKRIASLLARADRLRGLRRVAREQCDSLLQSVFLEMFGNINENNKGWHTTTIGQSMKLKSGDFLSSEMMDTRGIYPVYGGNGINGYHSAYMFDEPKICIGRVGVYCGAVHVTQQKSWITDNALYIEEIPANLNLVFLANYLKFKNLNQFADQAGQPLISQGRLTNVDIWLPSRILQEEFARVVARVEALRSRMDESARQGEALFQSLLAESFG